MKDEYFIQKPTLRQFVISSSVPWNILKENIQVEDNGTRFRNTQRM